MKRAEFSPSASNRASYDRMLTPDGARFEGSVNVQRPCNWLTASAAARRTWGSTSRSRFEMAGRASDALSAPSARTACRRVSPAGASRSFAMPGAAPFADSGAKDSAAVP
jgi:hypothetical protein